MGLSNSSTPVRVDLKVTATEGLLYTFCTITQLHVVSIPRTLLFLWGVR